MATGKEARLCTPGYGSHAANVLYVLQDRNGSNEYAVLPVYVRAPPVLGTARLACVYWYCCGETDFDFYYYMPARLACVLALRRVNKQLCLHERIVEQNTATVQLLDPRRCTPC